MKTQTMNAIVEIQNPVTYVLVKASNKRILKKKLTQMARNAPASARTYGGQSVFIDEMRPRALVFVDGYNPGTHVPDTYLKNYA